MQHSKLLCALTVIMSCVCLNSADAGQPEVRAAIERSLPYIEAAGISWIQKKECVSCHRVSFMTWALEEAASRGFDVDSQKLTNWKTWSREALLAKRDEDDDLVGSRNIEGVSQVLWAESSAAVPSNDTLLKLIIDGQSKNGSWKAGGQLPTQKRPAPETVAVSTAWNALTLGLSQNDTSATKSRSMAVQFLNQPLEAESTEWFAVNLLLAVQDTDADRIESISGQLIASQHDDGGWGWLTVDPSDALATGIALYALEQADSKTTQAARNKSVMFLTSTQKPDGKWAVKGTKKTRKGQVAETASYWGTCWATIALLSTLPDPP